MSEDLVIQSHKGPYTVVFDSRILSDPSRLWEGEPHFLIDDIVARLYSSQLRSVLARPTTIVIKAIEENKAIVRRYREAYNTNDMDALGEVLAADFIPHNMLPGLPPNLEGAKMLQQGTMATWPDLHVTTEDLLADGDRVVERWTQTQTHTGAPVFGVPANSGKAVRTTGISIYRIANGKIVEHWAEMDFFGVMVQLGVIPPLG